MAYIINFCVVYCSKDTQLFDFIEQNVIRKWAYDIKYFSQVNGELIISLVFGEYDFVKWVAFDCEQYGKYQYKKKI